jgi:hypothetical protein
MAKQEAQESEKPLSWKDFILSKRERRSLYSKLGDRAVLGEKYFQSINDPPKPKEQP